VPKKSVAVMLDAGFVLLKLKEQLRKHATADQVLQFSTNCVRKDEELFRVYYYDCPPFEEALTNPISGKTSAFGNSPMFEAKTHFLRNLAKKDHIAFRAGRLSCSGWGLKRTAEDCLIKGTKKTTELNADDVEPDFRQKRVDMKIGLDVAWLSSIALPK